jgi:putative membrane protein insertion efficiency factor
LNVRRWPRTVGNSDHHRRLHFSARTGIAIIDLYRLLVSPIVGPACRFEPSCSLYARQAIEHWGLIRGGRLASRRLLRCHPLGGFGYDPVPSHPVGHG